MYNSTSCKGFIWKWLNAVGKKDIVYSFNSICSFQSEHWKIYRYCITYLTQKCDACCKKEVTMQLFFYGNTNVIREGIYKRKKIVKNIWKTLTLVYSLICNKKAVKAKWFKSRSEDKNWLLSSWRSHGARCRILQKFVKSQQET